MHDGVDICPPSSMSSFTIHIPGMQGGEGSEREPGIEYEAESETELDELGSLIGGQGAAAPSRMKMLHQLWALGVPRRRGP